MSGGQKICCAGDRRFIKPAPSAFNYVFFRLLPVAEDFLSEGGCSQTSECLHTNAHLNAFLKRYLLRNLQRQHVRFAVLLLISIALSAFSPLDW